MSTDFIEPIDTTLRSEHTETPRLSALEAASNKGERRRTRKAGVEPPRDLPIAFLYLRVSTKEQARVGGGAEGYSIPAQRNAGHAKAATLNAVIPPEYEYVDAGESARSADRDELQRMLADIKTVRPDYLIVHKVDRLARNRADDIAINLLLKKHGVTLISCTENIDDTPSGRLLYGLLAELAQFYSGNLALEVLKGMVAKAEDGGTPFRAPLGYLNRRELRGGIDCAWVELDPERAEIIRWCLEQYAAGEWSGIDLTLAAQAKGLTTRPRAGVSGRPIGLTDIYHILQNPYYMGVVSYRGIHYEGKHEPLVEPEVWLACQDILAAHRYGEKNRVHPHYLRGTIYCSACGGRLVYSEQKGNGGTYPYYWCVKRKTKQNNCVRRAMRVERIEEAIVDFYGHFQLNPAYAAQIQQAVTDELATQQTEAGHSLTRATKRKHRLESERRKLLQAHYAGAIPQDLLASEMNRLTRELTEADLEIATAKATNQDVAVTLERALHAAGACQLAYVNAPHHIRKQINQGFFEKLLIGEDGSVERAELTEPFRALLDAGRTLAYVDMDAAEPVTHQTNANRTSPSSVFQVIQAVNTESDDTNTDRLHMQTVGGVNESYMVGAVGIEPTTAGL